MLVIRRIGAALLALAAVAVWFVAAPVATHTAATPDFGTDITFAGTNYTLNNDSAASAPQQQVVNGWVAKDLLTILAKEQQAALTPVPAPPRDNRIPLELLLVVVGLALLAGTTGTVMGRDVPEAATFTGIPGMPAVPRIASHPGSILAGAIPAPPSAPGAPPTFA